MSARCWRFRKDNPWKVWRAAAAERRAWELRYHGRTSPAERRVTLSGCRRDGSRGPLRLGHDAVLDDRVRAGLLRRDRRARRRGRPAPAPWSLPDADPFEDMRQAARLAGGEQPQRAVLARSQLDRLRPALDEAGALDA